MQTRVPTPPERHPTVQPRVIQCANCDVEPRDGVVRDGNVYCCDGCSIGGPCIC